MLVQVPFLWCDLFYPSFLCDEVWIGCYQDNSLSAKKYKNSVNSKDHHHHHHHHHHHYNDACHRPILPGTSFEPTVIPTAQASSFTLQYFPYYV
jgi:hypothetical protein